MFSSIILRTTARVAAVAMLLLSVFLYYRGHNAPGGGFIGGLVACGAFVLLFYAFGKAFVQKFLVIRPASWISLGLFCAYLSAIIGPIQSQKFFQGLWIPFPILGKIGTPMLFDFGVMAVVIGMFMKILMSVHKDVSSSPTSSENRTKGVE